MRTNTKNNTMPSVIEVREKTVNSRDVISFSKVYADEEHEVFAPKEHAVQVLLQLLAVINEDKDDDGRFLLVRKGQVGDGDVEPVDDELVKREVLAAVARELFDDDAAEAVKIVAGRRDPPTDSRLSEEERAFLTGEAEAEP